MDPPWHGHPRGQFQMGFLQTKRNLHEKMCTLPLSVRLAVNFAKLMPQPTLLKLPKCILRVAEKLFRHPLKSQAPGCKRRRESIILMDEDLMKPFPGSSTAFISLLYGLPPSNPRIPRHQMEVPSIQPV